MIGPNTPPTMSHPELVHSLVDTLKHVTALANLEFFVIIQDKETHGRRFTGSDELLELFLSEGLIPRPLDVRLASSRVQRQPTCELYPDGVVNGVDPVVIDDSANEASPLRDEVDFDEGPFLKVENTFSIPPQNLPIPSPASATSDPNGKFCSAILHEDSDDSTNKSPKSKKHLLKNKKKKLKHYQKGLSNGRRTSVNSTIKCKSCDKLFFSGYNLERHVQNVHLRLRPFQCTKCDKSFKQGSILKKHMATVHGSGNKSVLKWKARKAHRHDDPYDEDYDSEII